ncbi:MAG: hypothetical protein RLT05_26575, partial [Bauldia litoralis]
VVTSLLGLIVASILMIWGALAVWEKYVTGAYNPTVVEFPTWIVLLCIPLGSLVLVLRFLRTMIEYAIGDRTDDINYAAGSE